MTRATAGIGLLAFSLSTACFAANVVKGSGNTRRETRKVDSFDAVAVRAGIHLTVSIGDPLVEVKADDNVLALVRTEVKDGTLEVGFERQSWTDSFRMISGTVEVTVRTPRLREVDASGGSEAKVDAGTEGSLRLQSSGGSHITIDKAGARKLKIDASGGATVDAAGIDADELDAGGSGGAVLTLSGRAQRAKLRFSGGSTIKARSLAVDELNVGGSGGGEARLRSAESIKGGLSGGSTLHVGGSPRSKVSTSGGSEVVYEDGRRKSSSEDRNDRDEDRRDREDRDESDD